MNENFITHGIENDRYQKALRLVDQFETELTQRLENFTKATIDERPDLFVNDASPSSNSSSLRTEPLGHIRMDAEMNRENSSGENLTFHIAIEWTKPGVHGHSQSTDGTLCIILYKIKDLDRAEYRDVKQETQSQPEWDDIQFDDDLWNSNLGLFYIPVTNGPDVNNALETLRDHFFTFAESYGQ